MLYVGCWDVSQMTKLLYYILYCIVSFNVELVELVNGDLEVVVKVVEVQKEVWKRAR